MSKKINKDAVMSIRCTNEEKDKIFRKAKRENVSVSTYVTNASIAGLERNNSKEKKRVSQMVLQQQEINNIYAEIQKRDDMFSKDEVIELLNKVERGVNQLWHF